MKSWSFISRWKRCLLSLMALACLLNVQAAHAHLMVAQRGTLNIVGTGGYVVMALPVDAFTGVDDDGDGRMLIAEMRAHTRQIEAQVFQGLQLMGDTGPRPLQGLMLNLSPDDNTRLGAEHVLSGWDHLLFLLVVLATGWGFRQILLALTCFTLGHGITLAASALWGFGVPATIVEPTIAATIVGLALFDRVSQGRSQPWPPALRCGVIFVCALIHGLGFAGAMTALGVDAEHRILSLLGFNAGIEAGQLAVALLAAGVMFGIKRVKGSGGVALTTRFASVVGMVAGTVWLVERLVVSA